MILVKANLSSILLISLLTFILQICSFECCGGGGGGGKGGKGMGKFGKGMGKFGKGMGKYGKEKYGKKVKIARSPSPYYNDNEDDYYEPYVKSRPRYIEVPVYRPRYVERDYIVESPRTIQRPRIYENSRPNYVQQQSHEMYPSSIHEYQREPMSNPYELNYSHPKISQSSTERPSIRRELGRAVGHGLMKALISHQQQH